MKIKDFKALNKHTTLIRIPRYWHKRIKMESARKGNSMLQIFTKLLEENYQPKNKK